MEYLAQYGMFLAKSITVIFSVVIALAAMISISSKGKNSAKGLNITNLSEAFTETRDKLQQALLGDKAFKKMRAISQKEDKKTDKQEKRNMFVIDFKGDTDASQVDNLREEVSAVLSVANPHDEVVIRIESPGGVVYGYGLAASQLDRIKSKGIQLTVAVDKVAASGGYMMACVADKIIAAPFSLVGSIGVVAMFPNFNKVLKKLDVDVELFTAGEFKRTVDTLTEITTEGRQKFKEQLVDTHTQFKDHISKYRPALDINTVSTGEVWSGHFAVDAGLVDEIMTSDEYILDSIDTHNVFLIEHRTKKTLSDKFGLAAEGVIKRVVMSLSGQLIQPR